MSARTPSSQGPPMVPAEGGQNELKLESSLAPKAPKQNFGCQPQVGGSGTQRNGAHIPCAPGAMAGQRRGHKRRPLGVAHTNGPRPHETGRQRLGLGTRRRRGGGGVGRGALEGNRPQRRPQERLGRRLEGVAKAVGGGYCRLRH